MKLQQLRKIIREELKKENNHPSKRNWKFTEEGVKIIEAISSLLEAEDLVENEHFTDTYLDEWNDSSMSSQEILTRLSKAGIVTN
jgi:hypothetical protein